MSGFPSSGFFWPNRVFFRQNKHGKLSLNRAFRCRFIFPCFSLLLLSEFGALRGFTRAEKGGGKGKKEENCRPRSMKKFVFCEDSAHAFVNSTTVRVCPHHMTVRLSCIIKGRRIMLVYSSSFHLDGCLWCNNCQTLQRYNEYFF